MDSQLESFLNDNKDNLIKIYIKERSARGDGILHILKNEKKQNVDVVFLEMSQIPEELEKEIIIKKEQVKKDNIIYFYVCTKDSSSLVQIELNRE